MPRETVGTGKDVTMLETYQFGFIKGIKAGITKAYANKGNATGTVPLIDCMNAVMKELVGNEEIESDTVVPMYNEDNPEEDR